MQCIYHSRDLDGYCSAAVVKRKYPTIELIGYDYGEQFPWDRIREGLVIMVDVSLPMLDMLKLAKMCGHNLIWIDHHVSAINDFKEFIGEGETFCKAILEDGIAACEGAWKYLFPEEVIPHAVKLLGIYDTWRQDDGHNDWNAVVMPFQYGMRAKCNSPETFPMEMLDDERPHYDTMKQGDAILSFQRMQNEANCRKNAFEILFTGKRAIALCGGPFNSGTFDSVYDPGQHDLMMPFQYNGNGEWTVSLYTTKEDIDCSEIAKKFGGGGHRKAAGFQTNDIGIII